MFLSLTAVHDPYVALKSDYDALAHIENHCDRVYAAMIVALDRAVGTVLRSLKDNGLEDNTIVIFASDNGAPAYVKQSSNAPFRGWKATLFEGGIHVPLLMKWPKQIRAGSISNAIVGLIDIYPTVLAAAGVQVNHSIDGINLLPHIKTVEESSPDSVASDVHEELFFRSSHYMTLRKGDWKVQKAERPPKVWLFNLKNDPYERNNLVYDSASQEVLKDMLRRLHDTNATQHSPLFPSLSELAILVDKNTLQRYEVGDEYVYWAN